MTNRLKTFLEFLEGPAHIDQTVPVDGLVERMDKVFPLGKDTTWADFSTALYIYAKHGKCLWRGTNMEMEGHGLLVPRTDRRSLNGTGITLRLCSEHYLWKDFPRRDASLTMSTSKEKAALFGHTTLAVFPKNGANLGVCPAPDFCWSFSQNTPIFNIDKAEAVMCEQYEKAIGEALRTDSLENMAEDFERYVSKKGPFVLSGADGKALMSVYSVDELARALRPMPNGFKTIVVSQLTDLFAEPEKEALEKEAPSPEKSGRELWTDRECAALSEESLLVMPL